MLNGGFRPRTMRAGLRWLTFRESNPNGNIVPVGNRSARIVIGREFRLDGVPPHQSRTVRPTLVVARRQAAGARRRPLDVHTATDGSVAPLAHVAQDGAMATPSSRIAGRAPARTMVAVVTTGVGGYDRLVLSREPVPVPGEGEVLVHVLAAGVNNTDINTRLGWYSSSVTASTDDVSEDVTEDVTEDVPARPGGGWNAATPFPMIQGADCCGRVVAVGPGGDESVLETRVLIRPCMRTRGFSAWDTAWLGSDVNGAFAQFVAVPAHEAFPVDSHWSDAELATIPCAYGTAENMVGRAGITPGTRVLVTGASGGVGSAVVQLAKRRGAHVIGTAGAAKQDRVRSLGADVVIGRHEPPDLLEPHSVDVVIDNVAGPGFSGLLGLLVRGGRYVSSGAIGGPLVELDMRTLYLKDLTLIGRTAWDEQVFPDLISYIEREEIRPLLAGVLPLDQIATAQQELLETTHVGNFVLVPPHPDPVLAQQG